MKRAIILLLDSFGIGASLDAKNYGDEGSDTFGHIVETCFAGKANATGIRQGEIKIPNLISLGLAHAALASTGKRLSGIDYSQNITGAYGYAVEQSKGKDTPSGHWEIAGVPVFFDWGYFEEKVPCFPDELIQNLIQRANLPGVLGNKHASGTDIIEEFGVEHMRSGKPIIYTSADSVFQIAAHEETFGLTKLYDLCKISRELVDEYKIGRVIARPFVGTPGNFKRTANRKDLAVPPPDATLLEQLISQKGSVIAIGKTADIFAHQGITQEIKADGNDDHFQKTLDTLKQADDKSLIFTNFVDFDSKYGHRRDVIGYANALENLDAQLPILFSQLRENDLVIITADHGCDPTWPGTDHTREHIPVIAFSPKISSQFIGRRDSFADIGQTIATHLEIDALKYGNGFL